VRRGRLVLWERRHVLIALFAVFEKRHAQIVQMLERLREWDA
jgi:hypothetical protein